MPFSFSFFFLSRNHLLYLCNNPLKHWAMSSVFYPFTKSFMYVNGVQKNSLENHLSLPSHLEERYYNFHFYTLKLELSPVLHFLTCHLQRQRVYSIHFHLVCISLFSCVPFLFQIAVIPIWIYIVTQQLFREYQKKTHKCLYYSFL